MEQNIGSHLEALRLSCGFSLREAAKRSGLSHGYIRDVELGVNRKNGSQIVPMPQTLRKFAAAYCTDYNQLMRIAGHVLAPEIEECLYEFIELDLSLVLFIQVEEDNRVTYHLQSSVFTEVKSLTEYMQLEKKLESLAFIRVKSGLFANLSNIRAFDKTTTRIYFDESLTGKFLELSWSRAQKYCRAITQAVQMNSNLALEVRMEKPSKKPRMTIRNIVT